MEQLKPKIRNNHDERTFYSSISLSFETYRYSKLPRGKPHLSCSFKMADGDSKWKNKMKRNRLKNPERFLCCLPSYKLNPPMSNGTHEGSLSRRDTVCKSFRGGDTFFFYCVSHGVSPFPLSFHRFEIVTIARDPRNGRVIGKAWLEYDPGSNYPRELISRRHKPSKSVTIWFGCYAPSIGDL